MASRRSGKKVNSDSSSPPPARPRIGVRLRAARELRGWTREALAYHAGVSWAAIAQIESGRRVDVRLNTLDALASALEVSVDFLLGHDRAGRTLEHVGLLYRTREEFLRATVPYIREGLDGAAAVVAVTAKEKIKALRRELGSVAQDVAFFASDSFLHDPSASAKAIRTAVDERLQVGHPWVRFIGELFSVERTATEVPRWVRLEALINLVFASSRATILCVYDAASLPESLLEAVRRTHPEMRGERGRNTKYRDPMELVLLPEEQLV
jgi:transcriptional regulator with XRE-family HTH domain